MSGPRRSAPGPSPKPGPFFSCLAPLLDSLGWRGGEHLLSQVLPADPGRMGLEGLLNTMANLSFQSRTIRATREAMDGRLLPCLFVDPAGRPQVLLKRSGSELLLFDGASGDYRRSPVGPEPGEAVFFSRSTVGDAALMERSTDWFSQVMARVRSPLVSAGLISLALTVVTLATPVFIKTIYDQVLASRSLSALATLSIGIVLYLIADTGLRFLRARLLTYASIRLGNIVTNNVVRRILYLPPSYTETAPVASQIARVRDFDSVMEFFGGPAFIMVLELPCTVVLFGALVVLGGPLVLVPLAAAALLAAQSWAMHHLHQSGGTGLSQAESARSEFLLEMLGSMPAVRLCGGARVWARRYRELSADSCMNAFQSARLQAVSAALTQLIVSAATVATMALGVTLVLGGGMTPGSLMAGMMLVSAVLAPLRNGLDVLSQIGRIRRSAAQIDKLMNMPVERRAETGMGVADELSGRIRFGKVSHRYSGDLPPALLGVSFEVEPGEIFVVSGHDGAGKTTILKLLLAMHKPQAGAIIFDDININQLGPVGLREAIGYTAASTALFDGSVFDNLVLSTSADRTEAERVLSSLGMDEEVAALDGGLDAPASVQGRSVLTDALAKGVGLARALLRRRKVLLLDEPLRDLTEPQATRLLRMLADMKGSVTIAIASSDPRCEEIADKVLLLDKGMARSCGRPLAARGRQRQGMPS